MFPVECSIPVEFLTRKSKTLTTSFLSLNQDSSMHSWKLVVFARIDFHLIFANTHKDAFSNSTVLLPFLSNLLLVQVDLNSKSAFTRTLKIPEKHPVWDHEVRIIFFLHWFLKLCLVPLKISKHISEVLDLGMWLLNCLKLENYCFLLSGAF